MQVSPVSPQPRLILRIYQLHKQLRMKKQKKRIEEQKKYMQMLRQRKENPNLIPPKTHRPILSLTFRLFVCSYLVFLFACILFYVIPHPTKQLLGHQFYQIPHHNNVQKEIQETVVVKRIPFNTYRKGDSFLYQSNTSNSNSYYQVGNIQSIDVANYTITTTLQGNKLVISKEQLVGKVVHKTTSILTLIKTTTTVLLCINALILGILIVQIAKETKHYMTVKRYLN